MYIKDFYELKELRFLKDEVIPRLEHENDGVIFTKDKWGYTPGKTEAILKWKPSHLNTIDFYVKR